MSELNDESLKRLAEQARKQKLESLKDDDAKAIAERDRAQGTADATKYVNDPTTEFRHLLDFAYPPHPNGPNDPLYLRTSMMLQQLEKKTNRSRAYCVAYWQVCHNAYHAADDLAKSQL